MTSSLVDFLRGNKINSFQKLRLLLLFYQYPDLAGTTEQFAQRLYLADSSLLDNLVTELCRTGLVTCVADRYMLQNDPTVRTTLQHLSIAFDDPLTRQKILDQVTGSPAVSRYA